MYEHILISDLICIFILSNKDIPFHPDPCCPFVMSRMGRLSSTPFTLALLIQSETGFAPMRAFTLHQLIRINDLIRIKLNHLLEVVSHRFSLLRVLIASVDATGTRIKAEQI